MRTFIYKRTHKGDPRKEGCFGCEDCMGRLRGCDFDAVVGVGGISSLPQSQNINGKVNWIGIGPRKHLPLDGMRGPLVTFDHFVLFEENGPDLKDIAPKLARRILSRRGPRFVFSNKLDRGEQREIDHLLEIAATAPPSSGKVRRRLLTGVPHCRPKPC